MSMLEDILVSTTKTNIQLLNLKIHLGLCPNLKKHPCKDSIRKIIDDEYFWVEEEKSKSNEGKARNSSYKANLFFLKLLYPTNYALRERGYKKECITTT
jgi:hypothetical protein